MLSRRVLSGAPLLRRQRPIFTRKNQLFSTKREPESERVNPLLLAPLCFSALAVSGVIVYSLLPEHESELERFASGSSSSSSHKSGLLHIASANTIRSESSSRNHPPRLTIGEKVDREQLQARYVIDTSTNRKITVIGKGAYGRVLSARQQSADHTRVAMKVVSPAQMSAKALSMEVDVLKRVRGHDNIIHLLEVLECQNEWYLVTELCEGGDLLDRLISNGRYDEQTCASVLYNVASGLDHVHRCGYIHMDVKPENLVFVSKDVKGDDVRIVDFGMAKDLYSIEKAGGLALRAAGGVNIHTGEPAPRVGTVAYWSPEQILAGNAVNDKNAKETLLRSDPTKIDVWGLGVTAYIMLFGCHPFDVKGEGNEWQICKNVLQHKIDFNYDGIELTPDCKDLLRGLLEFDPAKRLTLEQALKHSFFAQQQRQEFVKQNNVVRLPNSWKAAGYAVERTREDDIVESPEFAHRLAPFKTVDANLAMVQSLLLAAVACADEEDEQFRTPKHLFRAAFDAMDVNHEGVITPQSLANFLNVVKRNTGESDHMAQAMERAAGRMSFSPPAQRVHPANNAEQYLTFEEFVALLRSLSCIPRTFREGDVLFEQGSTPQGVYLLVSGTARVEAKRDGLASSPQAQLVEEGFAMIPPGSIIGETAIVQGRTERSATIRITRDDSQVVYIPKQEFLLAVASSKTLQEKLLALTNEQQSKRAFQLFDRLQVHKETLRFGPGQILFKQRDNADFLYLLKKGTVELTVEGQASFNQANETMHVRVGTRKQGDVIGVSAMNANAKRATTATCSDEVEVEKISSTDLIKHMHAYPLLRFFMDSQKRWRNENWQQRLAEVERGISEPQILPVLGEGVEEDQGKAFELFRQELANAPVKEFAKGEYVFRRGDAAGEMFVIESGRCDVEIKNKQGQVMTITTLGPGDHIGEQAMLDRSVDYAFSLRCLTPVRAKVLAPTQLQRLMDKPNFKRAIHLLMQLRRHRWVSNLLNLAHESGVETEFIALEPDENLFQVGDPIQRLSKVLRGTIVIRNGGEDGQVVRTLNPGDTVGWEVFRKGDKPVESQMVATCLVKSVVEALTVDTIEELVENNRYVSKELEEAHRNAAPEFSSATLMIKRNSSKMIPTPTGSSDKTTASS